MRRRWFSHAIGDERALLQSAASLLEQRQVKTKEQLQPLLQDAVTNKGTNFATALLYQYLMAHEEHGLLFQRAQETQIDLNPTQRSPHLIIVPGMFAQEKPELGGDGALIRKIATTLGFSVSTAPLDGRASITENASALHHYLESVQHEQFWLLSISRGSADVKIMLQRYRDSPVYEQLTHWISISGLVTGTPLLRGHARRPIYSKFVQGLSKIQGISTQLAIELDCEHAHWSDLHYPQALTITHVMPVPLNWHVTSPVMSRYARLQEQGPTDGLVLLADTLAQPGHIYPIWGADHMLRVPNLAEHFYRLIQLFQCDE